MNGDGGKKLERALFLDMPFGEALARYAQTKPEEVKSARPKSQKKLTANPNEQLDVKNKTRREDHPPLA
jgi:hypothetical protein